MRPGDYREVQEKYRPSHADYTYDAKYGMRDWRGGGRTSARETAARVAAGAIARKLLERALRRRDRRLGRRRSARSSVECDVERVTRDAGRADADPLPRSWRWPTRMIAAVEAARKDGNSLGGVVTCAVRGCPPGWGEPVFDRLEADLAKAMMSLPASKGFEIGSGFAGTELTGPSTTTSSTWTATACARAPTASGGVQGGITNGETIYFRVAFKPTATIMREQNTVNVAPRGHDAHGPRPPRPVRPAARGADRRGDGRAGARRPRAPAPGAGRRRGNGPVASVTGCPIATM